MGSNLKQGIKMRLNRLNKEVINLSVHQYKNSYDAVEHVLHRTFRRYPTTFYSAISIHAQYGVGDVASIGSVIEDSGCAETYYPGILHGMSGLASEMPMDLSQPVYSAIQRAQVGFSERDCRAPAREDVLTGMLRTAIAVSLKITNEVLIKSELKPIQMYAVDLSVLGREARTGGDIAFIFDHTDSDGNRRLVPLCLQAKKANPEEDGIVCIKRSNKTDEIGDHQIKKLFELSKLGCNCGYVFYNVDDEHPIYDPILPIVIDVHDMMDSVVSLKANLHQDSVDMASYIVHTINCGLSFDASSDGLKKVADMLVAGEADHIVALSADPEFGRHLGVAFGTQHNVSIVDVDYISSGPVDFIAAFSARNKYASIYPIQHRSDVQAPVLKPPGVL